MIQWPLSIREQIIVECSPTIVIILRSGCRSNNSIITLGLNSFEVLSIVNPSGSSNAAEMMHSSSTRSAMILIPTMLVRRWHFNTIWMKSHLA